MGLAGQFQRALPRVVSQLDDLRFPCDNLKIEYRCDIDRGQVRHVQMFASGRLAGWHFGEEANVDLCLRQPLITNIQMLARCGLGNHMMAATRKLTAPGEWGWVPPFDAVMSAWGRDLPRYPGAGILNVQQVLYGSPLGELATWFRFDDGPIVASGVGVKSEADIVIRRRYHLAMLERLGRLDSLESLEGGRIVGEQGTLMFFMGIWDTEECVRARLALATPQDETLGVLGDLLSSPAWSVVARRLAAEVGLDSSDDPCPT